MVLLLTFLWGATTGAVPMLLIQLLDTTCSRSYTSGLASTCRQHDATQRARPNALVAKKSVRICHHPFAASQHSRLFLMLSLFLFPQYHEALRGKVLPKGKKNFCSSLPGSWKRQQRQCNNHDFATLVDGFYVGFGRSNGLRFR